MPRRVIFLAALISVVALVCYIYYFNMTKVTMSFGPTEQLTLPLALIIIGAFIVGILVAALFAFFLLTGRAITIGSLKRSLNQLKSRGVTLVSGREELAAGNYGAAATTFKKLVEKDPEDMQARILLAETYNSQGDYASALGVLDRARAEQKDNVEALFLAADLHDKLGNRTAAYDNVSMVLKTQERNKFALERLVKYCKELERYGSGIEFLQKLIRISPRYEHEELQTKMAELEFQRAIKDSGGNEDQLKTSVTQVANRHRNYAPALSELAAIEKRAGRAEVANKFNLKAYRASGDPKFLAEVAKNTMDKADGDKAVAVVRKAIKGDSEQDSLGQLFLVNLLLSLDREGEAKEELEKLKQQLQSPSHKPVLTLIEAELFRRDGNFEKAFAILYAALGKTVPQLGELSLNSNSFSNGKGIDGKSPDETLKISGSDSLSQISS